MCQLKLSGLAICLCLSQPLLADTLMLDSINTEPTNNEMGLLRPERGMTAQQVFNKFGKPLEEKIAIGNPPITRWVYSDFKVYFEYDHVIRSVVIRKKNN
ncbi:MAG: hypothetical protein DRQ61_10910 [Gammaproteobacteria bacterium]|nr:MAG: hypothetical protein DRQ61_10910 [Gammaproteobacteria bacterium]